MDLFRQFATETRTNFRPAIKRAGLWLFIPLILMTVAVSVYFFVTLLSAGEEGAEVAEEVPIESLAAAHIQSFNCIHSGPEECEVYDQATDYLVRTSPEEGITYTPLNEDDPGEPQEDGTHQVVLEEDTSDEEWGAVAAAATLNGAANPSSVNENSVTRSDELTGHFFITDADDVSWRGEVAMELSEHGAVLSSVTYEEDG